MKPRVPERIHSAEVLLPCEELAETQAFFTERLGFRLDAVFPADDPTAAVLSGHGLRIRLQRGSDASPGTLRLHCEGLAAVGDGGRELRAPNGTRIELVEASPEIALPPLQASLVVTRSSEGAPWTEGRAGMLYRDLIPGRLGGRFIASHIRIPQGGPVSDWVHYHRVRFQMIYCYRGSVRVVYEDQGEPFELVPGDCVLQPPEIRHRVLDCSDGLEVIEIGCPAEHETLADHELALPTQQLRPQRDFGGQRFLRHLAATAPWLSGRRAGFAVRELEMGAATGGLAEALVLRQAGGQGRELLAHDLKFRFHFVLEGCAALVCEDRETIELRAGDSWTPPAGLRHRLSGRSDDFELLEVSIRGAAAR